MRDHIVEIETEGMHLSASRGFFIISNKSQEVGKIPLDDIQAVIIAVQGASITSKAMTALAERGIPTIISGEKYLPQALVWPVQGNHLVSRRIQMQLASPKPLKKRLWQSLIKLKIAAQAQVLERNGHQAAATRLKKLQKQVLSGDSKGAEAIAAKYYWTTLFGPDYTRGSADYPVNAFLNYGYAILRSSVARATVAAGLHPAVSVFHTNRFNPFCLVDDLMEPFRPIVDQVVIENFQDQPKLETEHKKQMVNLLRLDLLCNEGNSPVNVCIQKFTTSVALSFEESKLLLRSPVTALPKNCSLKC